jgi:two-component system chemotaxis sensor kinase CheA
MNFANEMKREFITEATELLTEAESIVLRLKHVADPGADINRLFRIAHTIKGSSACCGYQNLAHFTHRMESLFDDYKENQLVVDATLSDFLLRCIDHLRA